MFNIGPAEIIVILLIALIVVGPKRLPEIGKTIGKSLREIRRATDDFKGSLDFDVDDYPDEEPNGQDPSATDKPPTSSEDAEP